MTKPNYFRLFSLSGLFGLSEQEMIQKKWKGYF